MDSTKLLIEDGMGSTEALCLSEGIRVDSGYDAASLRRFGRTGKGQYTCRTTGSSFC